MKIFAFDVGNGFVKAKSEKRTLIAPSMIAKESALGDSSIAEQFGGEKEYQIFKSPMDEGTSYVWGEGIKEAVEARKLLNTYTHNNRYDSKRFKLLSQFILAELASDFEEDVLKDVVVVTGMPSREIKTSADSQLKEFLTGKHLITRGDMEKVVNVKDVRILEQPLGTLLNLYMTDDAKIHKDLKTSTLSVLDFGAGTTILDTYKNMKRIEDESETYYEGMIDVYKSIANQIRKEHDAKNLDESMIEEGIRNNYTVELSARKKIPFEKEANQAINDFVDTLISKVDRTLASRDHIDQFIVTGGGSQIVAQQFSVDFGEDTLEIVENSQLANVEGYYKFAHAIAKKG
ncbi:ParM/StbA family protein [Halobacillus amylolyticus]|uniref:Plasmid segregation protein ParM n=1 Tax=Halobacillus amylolyticus TaxID=2932259 RepID=A0ABY4HGT0_9BACI|nr:plasmid segregation protein ParM domain-containing protein [Halobacillus amylolyticus]UOR14094.1 plasmid segregation protein ParM [Halobacillus amylolyticus]